MTVSKHTVRAEVVTPDTLSYGGFYTTSGSWQPLSPPAVIQSNDFETSLSGWTGGPTVTCMRSLATYAKTSYVMYVSAKGPTSFYARKTVSGLTVGRTYQVSAWAHISVGASSAVGSVGVAGIGQSSYVTLVLGDPVQISYTFVATATSHEVRFYTTASDAATAVSGWDDYELVATTQWTSTQVWHPETVSIPGARIPLTIEDASVTLDESWSPYSQVTLTCPLPAAETLAQIDPREGTRLQMWLNQRFGESEPLSAMSDWRVPVRTPGAVERTNLIKNPSFETNTTGWLVASGTGTLARVTSPAGQVGTACLQVTASVAGLLTVAITGSTGAAPVTAGLSYTGSAYVRTAVTNRTAYMYIGWYTAAGAILSTSAAGTGVTETTTGWTRLSVTATAPAAAAFGRVLVDYSTAWASSEVHYIDAVLFEKAVTLGSYFDGASTDTSDSDYAWTGTAHASTSTWAPASMVPGVALPTLADWSARYTGKVLASISEDYGLGYNAFGTRASTERSFDLTLVSREVDEVAGTMTLTCMSDEILAQDAAYLSEVTTTPGGTSLIPAVNMALSRISSSLYESVDDVTDLDPDALVWTPGTSCWDYMSNLVIASERRLWCDELGAWRLGYPAAAGEGVLHVASIRTQSSDTLTTEGWFDGVVVEWRWTDGAGVDHVKYENAGPAGARKVFKAQRDNKPWPRSGAAKTLLKWLSVNGRNVRIEAVSDYSATPGQVVNVTLPDGTYASGVIASVTWSIPGERMTITTRDLLEAPDGSWLEDTPGVSWDAIPVGIDWNEDI